MQILLVLTILGGQSHASKTNRLKHLGIFWGMSPMNPILTRGKVSIFKAHTR
jgi:hypothetical protein